MTNYDEEITFLGATYPFIIFFWEAEGSCARRALLTRRRPNGKTRQHPAKPEPWNQSGAMSITPTLILIPVRICVTRTEGGAPGSQGDGGAVDGVRGLGVEREPPESLWLSVSVSQYVQNSNSNYTCKSGQFKSISFNLSSDQASLGAAKFAKKMTCGGSNRRIPDSYFVLKKRPFLSFSAKAYRCL